VSGSRVPRQGQTFSRYPSVGYEKASLPYVKIHDVFVYFSDN
jgi:hypothetical protein